MGGALAAFIKNAGVANAVAETVVQFSIPGIIIPILIAALIHVITGSNALGVMTAAALVEPMLGALGISPLAAFLACGTGALMFKHANSSGFWVTVTMSNMDIRQGIRAVGGGSTVAGVTGAAIASASALAFAGGALLIAGFRQGERFRISLHDSFRPDRAIIRQAVHLGVPTAAERCTINLGQIAMTAVVASLSTVALAANHIATTAEGLCYLPAYGISFAGIALVGQAVGAGSEEDAQAYGRLAALLGFFLTLGTAGALFLLAPYLAALFNSDAEVVAQAALMLRIVSVSEPFFALSIILSGALRGAHDVRFPMVVGLLCMWGVRIVLAPILVYRAGMGLAGVWTAMAADLILRGVLCALRWRSGKWKTICGLERAGVLR